MDRVEERQAALSPGGNSSVNSLATTAGIVWEMPRMQADSSSDQIQQASKADAKISFPAAVCHEERIYNQLPLQITSHL